MKKSFLLCLLMTLFTTWAVQAAELTVHDGTVTNNTAPMYVFYFDDFTRSQTVFPAGELVNMKNEPIQSMKFYTSYTSAYTTASTVDIYLKEVEDASISEFVNKDEATIVYQGRLDFILEGGMATVTIEFTTPFVYNGGNLMFGCDNTTDDVYQNISFYGETVFGASVSGYNSTSLDNVTNAVARDFLPKTTFNYGAPPSCPKASGLTFTNITATSATMSWEAISNVSTWNFAASTEADFPDDADKTFAYNNIPASLVSGNTVDFAWIKTLTGFSLEPNTTYYVKLQANCGADGLGDWSNVASFRTGCAALALPFFDGFEEGIDCWKMVDCKEGSYGTGINNAEKYEGSYSFKFAYNTTPPQYLISPEFVAIDKEVIVEFYFKKGGSYDETFAVGYSTTDNEVGSFTWGEEIHGQSTWEHYLETLPAGVKYVAVKYTANNMLSLYIDNFSVYEVPACPKPTGLAATVIDAHHVQFAWNDNGAGQWKIQYCADPEFENFVVEATADATPFNVDGLDPETTYYARIQSVCEGAVSEWSNSISFTMPIACPAPTFGAEAVSNLGATEATIAWDGNGEDYTLSYRKARYVEGLEETFGTSIPTGWTMYTGLYNEEEGTATLTASTYGWSFGSSNGVFDNHARVNIYGNYQRWLVTPQFVLEGSSLEFDLALTAFSGTLADPQTTGDDDKFLVLLSEDKENWKVLAQWDNVGTEFSYNDIAHTASGEHVSLDLSDYEGSNIYIAFYGESTVSNADNNLHIDNVLCGTVHEPTAWILESGITEKSKQITGLEPETKYDVKVQSNCGSDGMSEESEIISFTTTPTCVVPANLTASDITAHTATFSWEGNGDAWQLSLSCSAGETVFNVDALPYSVETLDAETSYTVKVRTVCGEDYSDWYNAGTLITDVACPAPTNLEVELTPGDGEVASLLWAAAGSAEDWILQYSESAAFEPAQEITVNGNSFYDLDNLTPETTYYARVKAVCGDEDGDSQWSEPISFTPTNALSITLCDGTSNNEYVPFYGYYADEDQHNQMIYPAEGLAAMNGMSITQMVFYIDESANNGTNTAASRMGTWTVSLGETESTTLSGLDNTTSLTQVYEGYFDCSTGKLTIVFDAEYTYNGGNLLIDINHAAASYNRWYFYGVEATGASYSYGNQRNFLAKATFTYAEPAACAKPSGLTVEYNGGTEAVVSWTSDAESWNLEYGDALININQNPYTINLALATTYQVRVQALCSEENASDWTNVVEFTTDICLPEDMKTITYKLTDSYNDGWNGSAALRVVHKTTNKEVASLTLASGDSPLEGSLDLCCGEEYSFIWKKGSYDTECGFEIYDINGDIILSKEGCNSGCESPDDGAVLLDYTMNCSSGETPTGVEDVKNDAQVYKFVKDGNLFILHNGKLFNAQGKFVK